MRAGDRDALFEPHQFSKHFGTTHDGQTSLTRSYKFRIVAADRRRNHDDFGLPKMTRIMADVNRRALGNQAFDIDIFRCVGALHFVAEIKKHLGDPRHSDTADADKVNGA